MEHEAFKKLEAISNTKKSQVETYFNFIKNQVVTFSEDKMIITAMKDFRTAFHNIENELGTTDEQLSGYNRVIKNYYENEFLTRLNKNTNVNNSLSEYFPEENKTKILQYLYFANNPNPTGEKDNLDNAFDGSTYSSFHSEYHPVIRDYLKRFGYYDIFLIDHETGHIVYTVFKEVDYATSLKTGPYKNTNFARAFNEVATATEKDFVYLEDFEKYDPSYSAPASFIASPIFDGDEKVGVLAFQMPVDEINSIMTNNNQWANVGFGQSGECYLIGSDFKLRSNSRFLVEDQTAYLDLLSEVGYPDNVIEKINTLSTSILFQEVNSKAAKEALNGNEGTEIVKDYRDVSVLSSYAPLNVAGFLSEIDEEEAFAAAIELRNYSIIVTLIIGVLVSIIGVIIAGKISSPVVKISEAAKKVAGGGFVDIEVKSNDEIGELAGNFNVMVNSIKTSKEELVAEKKGVERKVEEAVKESEKQKKYLEESVNEILDKMNSFAEGDLTVELEIKNGDQIGKLFIGFNNVVNKIREMIIKVSEAVQVTASASSQISSSSEEMAAGAQEQSAQTNEVAASVEQMTKTIMQSADSANRASELSKKSGEYANLGYFKVNKNKESIEKIMISSENTGKVITALAGKTDQIGEDSTSN
ncbi:MAG: HAMP domain-containing protein [Ignavibacteria bacterium]|jgi:methyl-accepting chemotaxis protein